MSDEVKPVTLDEVMSKLHDLFAEFQPQPVSPDEQAAAEARADARTELHIADNNARFAREVAYREQQMRASTAATILAALLVDPKRGDATLERCVSNAVGIADALRDELAKVPR